MPTNELSHTQYNVLFHFMVKNMSDEKKKNIIEDLNKAVLDLGEKVFGEKGREFLESTQKKVKEFNVGVVKSFLDFTDKILESTKLSNNEMVQKSQSTVKDLLRQAGMLEEEKEDDF
jgi:hypothetical protein